MYQDKKPFKLIEIPLSKFKEVAVPFHRTHYEKHRTNIQKILLNDEKSLLSKEAREISTSIQQLKQLATELVTLKTEVEDGDISRFKTKAEPIYEDISDLVCKYNTLQQLCVSNLNTHQEQTDPTQDSYINLQIQENIDDLKLEQHQNRLKNVENLHEDIQNVHGMFIDLHQLVNEQSAAVTTTEGNIEHAHEDVQLGFREIIKASKLKKASYPILGASFGAIAGGPVGAVVGIKAGLLAAATCAVFGYFTGRYMRTHNDGFVDSTVAAVDNITHTEAAVLTAAVVSTEDKKCA